MICSNRELLKGNEVYTAQLGLLQTKYNAFGKG